jgi:hypothetical protein
MFKALSFALIRKINAIRINRYKSQAQTLQSEVLKKIINRHIKTTFSQDHSFHEIKNYIDYKERVPLFSHQDYFVHTAREFKYKNHLLLDDYDFIVNSSQTTDLSLKKELPFNQKIINSSKSYGFASMIHACAIYSKFYLNKIYYLTGSPKLKKNGKYLTGMISSVFKYKNPKWMQPFTFPKEETAAMEDFKEKMQTSAQELSGVNLKMVAGTPPWFMYLFQEMNKLYNLDKDFKSLDLVVYGGSHVGTYRNHINKLLGRELYYFETFAATEGFIGYQYFKDKNELLLNIDGDLFYEFVELEDFLTGTKDKRFPLWEIKVNQRYVPYITNISGLYSYFLGDIFEFTQTKPYLFKYIGRTKHVVNGLYEHDFTRELYSYIKEKDCFFTEFCFSQDDNGEVHFIVESLNQSSGHKAKTQALDISNLLPCKVDVLVAKPKSFYQLMEKNHKIGGQFKVSKVDPDGTIIDFLKNENLLLS